MPAKNYNDLSMFKQGKRLEMLGESVGISRKDYSQYDPESTSRGYGKKGDYDDFEKDVISAINNDYDYRTAMQYSNDAPKAVNNASEALDVYRLMKKAHKDQGHTGEFSSANDLGSASNYIAKQHFDSFNEQDAEKKVDPYEGTTKFQQTNLKPVQLSQRTAEGLAGVQAHKQRFDSAATKANDMKDAYALNLKSGVGKRGQGAQTSSGWDNGINDDFYQNKLNLTKQFLKKGYRA